jgi:hypothetical protein
VFGSAVGIIAGRTVTRVETAKYPVVISYVPKGVMVSLVHRNADRRPSNAITR